MFEKLQQNLRTLTAARAPFDPGRFGDPLALRTEWTPAKRGGASFRTHKLAVTGPNRIEFRPALGAILFYLLFFIIGLGVFAAISVQLFAKASDSFDAGLLVPLGISLVFSALGAYMLSAGTAPVIFERGRGVFWKGRKGPDEAIGGRNANNFVRLDQVHALQLISEYIRGKNSYYSYELNLVLEDGKRINVVDHGNLDRIRTDAGLLAVFIGKPLWDATICQPPAEHEAGITQGG
jgi:hypothetical protein